MALHPGSHGSHDGGGSGLAGAAASRQGIPQGGIMPTSAPDPEALSEVMQMLRGGQIGGERFMQLLSLLAGSTLPGMDGPTPEQAEPNAGGGVDLAGLIGG